MTLDRQVTESLIPTGVQNTQTLQSEEPSRHRTNDSTFYSDLEFLKKLEGIIQEHFEKRTAGSYIAKLIAGGLDRVAQKVGEEAIEAILAAKSYDKPDFENEAADLIFHLMILLKYKATSLANVVARLQQRHEQKKKRPHSLSAWDETVSLSREYVS